MTFHFRVRYTAGNPQQPLQSEFDGMISNGRRVSATSRSEDWTSASARPSGSGGLSALAVGLINHYYGYYPVTDTQAKSMYTPVVVSLPTRGIDANGSPYSEGTVDLKTILDVSAPSGTAEAHDSMWLVRAKALCIERYENTLGPRDDHDHAVPGLLEPDEYNADGSVGRGHSRYDVMIAVLGKGSFWDTYLYGEVWKASLLGAPWPDAAAFYPLTYFGPILAQREWHWYDSLSGAATGGIPNGATQSPGPDDFKTDRPNHTYPRFANPQPTDMLNEMQSSELPKPDAAHIFLHVIDSNIDSAQNNPEWNYNGTANFYATFHNRVEEPTNLVVSVTPLTSNPWHKYHPPTTLGSPVGTALQTSGRYEAKDAAGNLVPGSGTFPWNPGNVTAYLENSISASLSCSFFTFGTDMNSGNSVSVNVPSATVPLQQVGTVYYHILKQRTTFNYKEYLKGGRHILGFNADGTEIPHQGYVDRSGGIEFIIWVREPTFLWPETTDIDLPAIKP